MQVRDRLRALRSQMKERELDAYIIPSSDPHISEYPPACWAGRAWLSGFHGSAGTLVVTTEKAGLWTDSRYFIAAEQALAGSSIELFREGEPQVPSCNAWLADELSAGDRLGFDASVHSVASARSLSSDLSGAGVEVVPSDDLLDKIWTDRPGLPSEPIFAHETRFCGSSRGEKLSQLRLAMDKQGATHHLVCTLDDIAWLLNLRGSDVPYNPVFIAYLLVSADEAVLFVDETKLPPELSQTLRTEGVTVQPYGTTAEHVGALAPQSSVLYSPEQTNVFLERAMPDECRRIELLNPSSSLKARKSSVELESLSRVMVRDGVAMVELLSWLSRSLENGDEVDELGAEEKLRELRSRGERFVSESFRTIAAYRGHGAIVHYGATRESAAQLQQAGLFLLDSGGQYLDGTTDITRTVALGHPTVEQQREFTLVLKAHISLATLRFPPGTTGVAIDAIARHWLWRERLNYGHGTGHGVGFFLNVHEGPQRIAQRRSDVPLEPGMLVSNEPGLYRTERYGIRIENLVVVREDQRTEFGTFLRFDTLTLCPIDRSLIEPSLLTDDELEWVNGYHRDVRDALRGGLCTEAAEWLDRACEPVVRL